MKNINARPKINFEDIDKYKFGGLQIDEEFENGFHLYIPYILSLYLSDAVKDSLELLKIKYKECNKNLKNLQEIKNKNLENIQDYFIKTNTELCDNLEKDIKILEKLQSII